MIKYVLTAAIGLGAGWLIARFHLRPRTTQSCTDEVLFFPDTQFPCSNITTDMTRIASNNRTCYNPSCSRLHGREGEPESSFIKFLTYLASAKHTVDLCVFVLTQQTMTSLLIELSQVGVRVRIITHDAEDEATSKQLDKLSLAGIEIKTNKCMTGGLMHHKFVLVDGQMLISGSFNWTNSAVVKNFEAVMITRSPTLVGPFMREFDKMWSSFKTF